MGQAEVEKRLYSLEEWLALEESDDIRYEFHFGEVFAMAGGTLNHARIGKNAAYLLEDFFRESGKNCEAFQADLKVEIQKSNRYVYPDTLAVCGDVEESEKITGAITNPVLVIEVVSDSSESYDRGQKYRYYRRLPSVKEYLLLEQKRAGATLYRRNGDGDLFTRIEYEGPEAIIDLQCVELEVPLMSFYRNVELPPKTGKTHAG